MSGFMPRHIEQPDSRHSKPAVRKIRSSPSPSAMRFTFCDPGTTMARTELLTVCPRITRAAARKSSMRAFVHDPMKTRSIAMSEIFVRGLSAMYSSARSIARCSLSVAASRGSGTSPLIEVTIPGLVPQVTQGAIDVASISTMRSKVAVSSERNERQYLAASSHCDSAGENRRPLR